MPVQDAASDPLDRARSALFSVCRSAAVLADAVARLEEAYSGEITPPRELFYVPTEPDDTGGTRLAGDWTDSAPTVKRRFRRAAIDATFRLRMAVDSAIPAIANIADYMDGDTQAANRRWTVRTISRLRRLRGAILHGHILDAIPSALPTIGAGVPELMREHAAVLSRRMEEVKSAKFAGVRPRARPIAVTDDLLALLQRAIATNTRTSESKRRSSKRGVSKEVRSMKPPIAQAEAMRATDWRSVQGFLLRMRERGRPYSTLRLLAKELCCSDRTIRKAIDASPSLKGWKRRGMADKAGPKATSLRAFVTDSTAQTREKAPHEEAVDDNAELTLQELVRGLNPDERDRLQRLSAEKRRDLSRLLREQREDHEPSSVERDPIAARPRAVRQPKRA